MSQFNTTELDFNKIKTNLINYFKRSDGPYRDFDFKGAGLDQLMDILAYNTHYNAVNAHMAMNESFLDSAQVRGNVVSRAKLLGYTPKSVTAASASINLTLSRKVESTEANLTIPKGTQFTSVIDNTTYIFETDSATTTTIDSSNNTFTFNNLMIKQGATRIEDYTIDNSYDQRFIINSQKADTSTLKVEVFPTIAAIQDSSETYTLFTEFPNVDGTSKIYFLDENSDGNYEVRFGNNLFGARPSASGLVRLTYLVSDGPLVNGAAGFSFKDGQIGLTNVVQPGSAVITVVSSAAGGNTVEDINSIKYNAPLSFIAQERAVTSDDYKSLIMKNFTGLDNVVTWGGETESIPQFGKVYISVKPTAAEYLTSLQKEQILSLLASKKIVGMTPEIVDPEYTYVFFEIFFKYNPTGTTTSAGGLASVVKQVLTNYNATELNNFDGVFRYSNLLARIDNSNPAILNSIARVKVYKDIRITANSLDSHSIAFDFELDGDLDQPKSMISSSAIIIGGKTTYLEDEPIAGDNEKRKIYGYTIDEEGRRSRNVSSAGFVYPQTGLVDLLGLVNDFDETLTITVKPAADDIISRRRKILQIDINKTSITGDVDNISVAGSAGLSQYTTFNRDS